MFTIKFYGVTSNTVYSKTATGTNVATASDRTQLLIRCERELLDLEFIEKEFQINNNYTYVVIETTNRYSGLSSFLFSKMELDQIGLTNFELPILAEQ